MRVNTIIATTTQMTILTHRSLLPAIGQAVPMVRPFRTTLMRTSSPAGTMVEYNRTVLRDRRMSPAAMSPMPR